MGTKMENKKYFENLDGLRGYAALAVFIYHLNLFLPSYWQIMEYGWIWVSVFFTLSGFLITNILLKSKDTDKYFSTFYFHRALRILPLYFLCLGWVTLIWILQWHTIDDLFAYIFFVQNWIIWFNEGIIAFPGMFGHSWTIAIEQQFYCIWPIIIRYGSLRSIKYFCIGGIILAIFSRFYLFEHFWWYATWYSTFSYIDTLMGWSLLALLYRERRLDSLMRYSIITGICSLLWYAFITYVTHIPAFWEGKITSTDSGWPLLMILVLTTSVALVHYLLVTQHRVTLAIFSNSIISYIGKISYGIYLYHVIILHVFDTNSSLMLSFRKIIHLWLIQILSFFTDLSVPVIKFSFLATIYLTSLSQILLTLFIAHISYKYFEKRFLSLK